MASLYSFSIQYSSKNFVNYFLFPDFEFATNVFAQLSLVRVEYLALKSALWLINA